MQIQINHNLARRVYRMREKNFDLKLDAPLTTQQGYREGYHQALRDVITAIKCENDFFHGAALLEEFGVKTAGN